MKCPFALGIGVTLASLILGNLQAQTYNSSAIGGQNGWAAKPGVVETVETSLDSHSGDQLWHLANRGPNSNAVQVTSTLLVGGVGESGAVGNPVANSASLEFWTRTADESWSADTLFSTSFGALASKRITSFGMSATSDGVFARVNDFVGLELVQTQSTQSLEWGTWYRVVVNASFIDGQANDVVGYEVFNDGGDSLWQATVGSWEEPFYSGDFEPSRIGHIMTSTLLVFNGGVAGNGFYFDDITLRTWNSEDPETTVETFSTGFESVPEPGTVALLVLSGILGLVFCRRIAPLAGPARLLIPLFGFSILAASKAAAVDYSPIETPGIVVTGVRSTSSSNDDVVITASSTTGGVTTGALYSGSLAAASGMSSWVTMTPTIFGQTITSSTLYGPNTSLFTPGIGAGNVIAVGSYKYTDGASGPGFDHGLIYQGSATANTGTYTQIDANALVTSGSSLVNTIAHSNMGSLVVGNYDTDLATGHAFIYNLATEAWTNLNPMGSASVTAYGIWQNSETSFTIAGGFSDVTSEGLDEGYLVNYDSSTGLLTDFKSFNFDNQPLSALVSHFDGITATETGFNLTGDYVMAGGGVGAFFASVSVLENGSFGNAAWTDIAVPGADFTSGNTVVGDSVLGISSDGETTSSYIAVVPEPSTWVLLGAGLFWIAFALRRKLSLQADVIISSTKRFPCN